TNPGGKPAPALRATYELPGLPAGNYTVEIEAIDPTLTSNAAFPGSDQPTVGPLDPPAVLPGPAEFRNGANERHGNPPANPASATAVAVTAGATVSGINIILNGTPTGPSDGDDACTTPTVIAAAPFSKSVGTTGATTGIYDPFQTCTVGGSSQNTNSVWFRYTPPGVGAVTVTTAGSDYDT